MEMEHEHGRGCRILMSHPINLTFTAFQQQVLQENGNKVNNNM
jgi:hypothetical protein